MAIKLNTPDWQTAKAGATRAATRSGAVVLPGLPAEFLTTQSSVADEFVAEPRPQVRAAGAAPGALDFSSDLAPGQAAVLAVRHESGALTFHAPVETTRPTRGGPAEVRFIVSLPRPERNTASRGAVSQAIKAIVVKVAGQAADAAVGLALGKLARAFETAVWKRKELKEGWLKVDKATLRAGRLAAGRPKSTDRSLLLIHGTFSNAAAAYSALAASDFFEQVAPLYGDRIFAFDHFSLSRTPEENARMLLETLPEKPFTFDAITHSRGGLVLRNLVERQSALGSVASRFLLGQAVLVAAPNEGTPLATPKRWQDTVGWIANLLEIFPENPFTTGAEFVANGLVWIARHASGDLPGIHAMDADGEPILELQGPPKPPVDRYSALVANFNPPGSVLRRLADAGIDQFFNTANDLVVPSEGGWRVDPLAGNFIPGTRIGCFGPGGNIPGDAVTHVNFFSQADAVTFIVKALAGRAQSVAAIDPAKSLPDRRLLRSGAPGAAAPSVGSARPRATAPPPVAVIVAEPPSAAAVAPEPLDIAVVNGDLSFEQLPLMVGHYRATLLTGTEKVVNGLLDDAMKHALDLGVYPSEPTMNRIFINTSIAKGKPWVTPRPKAVLVAGLGREGKLQSMDIVRTVRQAVIAWSERAAEQAANSAPFALASTLLGSGGTGVTAGQAAQLIAQGVHEANEIIDQHSKTNPRRLPRVGQLRFVELYLDRASEAWRALKLQSDANPGRFKVAEPIVSSTGWLRRPLDSGYRGADYDFITAETRRQGNATSIAYALDTKRARTEVRAQATQSQLLRNLVATASSSGAADDQLGKTLFRLLIPLELEGFLAGSTETQIELDEGTAGIPWELLDGSEPEEPLQEPWAIRSKLLRKFKTENFRSQVTDADTEASILVIGEPECPPEYPPLPGARQEAKDVYACLTSDNGIDPKCVRRLFTEQSTLAGPDALTVVNALFERNWRVIHIAGHGEPKGPDGGPGGVVLSNDTFLGPNEIEALRVVPELVFINCCYIGGLGTNSVLRGSEVQRGLYDRTLFAAGVAEALINMGVRCVVAAGWAVDDDAAGMFAKTFYQALLRRERFIDAVAQARIEARKVPGNTWAAYQCYGDPDWILRRNHPVTWSPQVASPGEFDHIGSVEGLRLALETLIVQSTYQRVRIVLSARAREASRGSLEAHAVEHVGRYCRPVCAGLRGGR